MWQTEKECRCRKGTVNPFSGLGKSQEIKPSKEASDVSCAGSSI